MATVLRRRALHLKAGARLAPPLLLVTDPARTPDPASAAARLPRGSGVVFRGFGAQDAADRLGALACTTRARGVVLLVGADPRLAAAAGAAGVHLPERALHRARAIRRARPGWIVTGAAHSAAALVRARRAGLDGVFVSPVFATRSPSGRGVRPLGTVRFAALVRGAGLPVYALGGVDARTARRLMGSGAAGLAAVDALAGPRR